MGCDIHVYLEKKSAINGEEKWHNVDYWQLNPYFGIDEDEDDEYDCLEFYRGRNYELFGYLAGVRSSQKPIRDPRGLPKDVTSVIKKISDKWDSDAHTHSYYTLRELKNYMEKNSKDLELMETLSYFIKPLLERFDEEFRYYRDEDKKECEEKFRVIFWFDN